MINKHEHICLKCVKSMRKIRSGYRIRVESMAGIQNCDIWECQGCGAQILTGFGDEHSFGSKSEDLYIERLTY